MREKQKVKSGISQFEKGDGSLNNSDKETLMYWVISWNPSSTLEPKVNSDQHIDEAHFTIQDVAAKLKDLKIDKSPGMDGIHTRVLN